MSKKSVSARDVAEAAGVSRTTVSFVLNNTPGKSISEGTRQRVLSAAAELGYRPNEAARALALSKRRTFGLVICHSQFAYTDAFIMRVIEGMTLAVNRARVRLVVHPISLTDADYLDIARQLDVDGLVLINTHDNDPGLEELIRSGFPSVAMDDLPDLPISQVFVDGQRAAETAVQHLIDLGHTDIGMISHARGVYAAARQRIAGYHARLDRAGISAREDLLVYGDFSERSGYDAMRQLLALEDPPTAVFAGNDVVAYGAIDAIRESGLRIPDDVSIVGFDDDYISRYLNPPLTSVIIPAAGMGSTAVSILAAEVNGEAGEPARREELPTQMAVRESTAPPTDRPSG